METRTMAYPASTTLSVHIAHQLSRHQAQLCAAPHAAKTLVFSKLLVPYSVLKTVQHRKSSAIEVCVSFLM